MDGRSRMNKYQDLRRRVAGESEGSTVPRNGTARDNSYNLRHSRGGVSSGDVFNDDTGSLNTRATRNLTTDYDEMLREQEEFLRSLEEQFDVFRNTGSFSTVREENAEEVQAFDDAIPLDVKLPDEKAGIEETAEAEPETTEEPVIEEEVTEAETVEEETVEETAEIEQPVETPVIEPEEEVQETVTEEEATDEPEQTAEESSEEEVTEIEPEETEEPEAENLEGEYPQQEPETAEEEPAEAVEKFTEEADVIEEQTEESEQESEASEEPYEKESLEGKPVEEPEELNEPEVTESVTEEEIRKFFEESDSFEETSDDEEKVPSDVDFDNRFGLSSEHEDFNEILDSLKIEDDVIDNTYMSLDMPWTNRQTNEPFEFFEEKKEETAVEPVHTQKLPRVSSVFGPMDGIKNTGYDDPMYDLHSYNTFVQSEPETDEEDDYKLIEPETVTEKSNVNDEEEVEVVRDAYPDLIPQIPNEYTPSEYVEDPIVPVVDETMQSFDETEEKTIEETIDEKELADYEDYSGENVSAEKLDLIIDEPLRKEVEEKTEIEEVPLAETTDYSEEELSPIIGDYALEFMKQNDIGIPEKSEFTDTFADFINNMNAENGKEESEVHVENALPENDEGIIQEDDEELYRDLLEETSSDFNEDMFFNRKREEPVIIEESQLDMDIQQDPQIETDEPAETEEPLVEINEIESEDSQELREGTVEQQQLEIVDEALQEAVQHEEGQDIMDNDQVNYEENTPEQEISFDDMYVEPLDIAVDDYYTEFEYGADATDELISDTAVDEIVSEPNYEKPAEELSDAAKEVREAETEVQKNVEEQALEESISEQEVSAFDFQPVEEVQEAEPEVTEPEEYNEQPEEVQEEPAEFTEPEEQPQECIEEEPAEEIQEEFAEFTEPEEIQEAEEPVQETVEFEGIPDVEEEFVEPFVEYTEPHQFVQEEPVEFTESEEEPVEEPVEFTDTVEEIQEESAEYAEPVEEAQEEPMEYVEPAEETKEEPVEEKAEEPIFSFDFNDQPEETAEGKIDLPFENAAVKKPQYDLGVNVRPFNIERTTPQPAETKSSDVPEYDFSIDDELNDMEDMFSSEPLEDSYNDVEKILRDVKAYNIAHGIRNAEDTQVNIMAELRQQEAKESEAAKVVEEKKPARGGIFAGFFNANDDDDEGYEADNPVTEPDVPVFEFTDFEEPETEEPEFRIEEPAVEEKEQVKEIEQPFMEVEKPSIEAEDHVREPEVKAEEPVKEVEEPVIENDIRAEETEVRIDEPVQKAEEANESASTTLTDLNFNEEYALDEDDSFYELDSTPVVAPTMEPEYQPQLQKQESDSTRENREHLNELTQKIEMERELRQEMFEQTQQLKLQVSEYENELNDVNNNVSRTNRILNVVLTLLIIALFVIIVIIGFFFAQERGLI